MPNWFCLTLLGATLLYLGNPTTAYSPTTQIKTFDSAVSLTAVDKYTGMSINEEAKIYSTYDDMVDLGKLSLNDNQLSTFSGHSYRFYFYINDSQPSEDYYVDIIDYDTPENGEIVTVTSQGCKIAKSLSVQVDYNNRPVTELDPVDIGANDIKHLTLRLTVPAGECYGMPGTDNQNAICFVHDMEIQSENQPNNIPYELSRLFVSKTIDCYNFPLIENGETVPILFSIKSVSDPNHNDHIYIYTEDSAFDIKTKSFEEIFGFEDEYNNNLGSPLLNLGEVYVS